MRKHLYSKEGQQLRQEELVPMNIQPTEGGMYGYPLAYPFDFELSGQSVFHFQTQMMKQNAKKLRY